MSLKTTASSSLAWCQRITDSYPEEARVSSLTSRQWLSGSAFCAILHATDPSSLDYDELHQSDVEPTTRLRVCFELAEKQYGVAPLLDAGDWAALSAPEPKTLKLYVQALVPKLQEAMEESDEADKDDESEHAGEEASGTEGAHLAGECKGPTDAERTGAGDDDEGEGLPPKPRRKRRVKKKKAGFKIGPKRKGAKKPLASKKGARVEVSITPDDIGKHVWCKGGSKGVVRFVGSTKFSTGVWVGVEFTQPIGKNDGNVKGVHYFSCQPKHGSFLRPSSVRFADLRAHRASLSRPKKATGVKKAKPKTGKKPGKARKIVTTTKATSKRGAKNLTKKSSKTAGSKAGASASASAPPDQSTADETAPTASEPNPGVAEDEGVPKASTAKKKTRKLTSSAGKKTLITATGNKNKSRASPPKKTAAKKSTVGRKKTVIGARPKKTVVARKSPPKKKTVGAKKSPAGRKSSVANPSRKGSAAKKIKQTKAKAKNKPSDDAEGAEAPPLPTPFSPRDDPTEF